MRMTDTTPTTPRPLTVGDQVKLVGFSLAEDRQWWTVRAVSDHFAAATRPVTAEDREADEYDRIADDAETFYTVLDWRDGVRGPCNLIGQSWGDGTYSEAECAEMLAEFESGELEVSHRNRVRIELADA